MSEVNNTTKRSKNQYHHLKPGDRAKIQSLIEQKDKNGKRLFSNSYIADYIGVHKSTISRELKKRIKSKILLKTGRIKNKPYNAVDAQNDYILKRGLSKGEYILRKYPEMAKFIEDKIKIDEWAPDVIVGYMKTHGYFEKEGFHPITVPTVYNAIRLGIINVKLKDTRRMKNKKVFQNLNYHTVSKIDLMKLILDLFLAILSLIQSLVLIKVNMNV